MNQQLRKAVRAEARKTRAQRKARVAETIAARYDAVKTYEFPERDLIHMERHFYFPKIFGPNLFGSTLSKAAIAVYPVMCSRANFENNDWFQLPQEAIAKMAGVSIPTASEGVKHLVEGRCRILLTDGNGDRVSIPLLERRMTTEGTRHFYLYRAGFIRKDMLDLVPVGYRFIFYTCIIDSGVWAELLPRAKALYLAMRNNAKQNYELYREIEEGNGFDWMTPFELYLRIRKWDVCGEPLAELGRQVNISVGDIGEALEQLKHHRLVERVGGRFMVYLQPKVRETRNREKPQENLELL